MKQEIIMKLLNLLLDGEENKSEVKSDGKYPIGEKIIIRGYDSGVLFGTLISVTDGVYRLKDARRLWSWFANTGISLEDVAVHGIKQSDSRITSTIPLCDVTDNRISLLLQCSKEAIKSIEEAPVYTP